MIRFPLIVLLMPAFLFSCRHPARNANTSTNDGSSVVPAHDDDLEISRWSVAASDPISTVGHGAIIDSQGKEVDPSPEFVLAAQRFYIKQLYQHAPEKLRQEVNDKRRAVLQGKRASQAEQIRLYASLIDWLLEAVRPTVPAHLAVKSTALRNRFFRDPARKRVISPTFLERLRRQGLTKVLTATTAAGEAYVAECRRAGVPIPPDWGSPAWQPRGVLTTKFIVQGSDAEVFFFESDAPRGACFALPRSQGSTISALGIICLGTETSNSCFWDNVDRFSKNSFTIAKGSSVPLSGFAGGADLLGGNGVCTDCHAGENPFIVHPGTPLDLGAKNVPANWQDPLVHPSWPQNAGPTNVLNTVALGAGEESCLTCHKSARRFPEVSTETPGYCGIILKSAFSSTMPPGDAGNPKYDKHFKALQAACTQPPKKVIEVVVNGATKSTPEGGRSDTSGELGPCTDPKNCPLGFCYWRTLHGPFWQKTGPGIALADADYRGSFLKIYSEAGKWKWRAFSDATGGPPNAPPGGTAECLVYQDIAKLPDPLNCFANQRSIVDPTGKTLSGSVDASGPGVTANVLSGYIGNVAQTNAERPDLLRVVDEGGRVLLKQSHNGVPLAPFDLGPMIGESWINGCNGWVPQFAAKEVLSTSDVQLVPYPQARDVRCFITGISGAWSSTRNGAIEQPFAEIYVGPGKDVRLRVSPSGDARDRVGAYASCIVVR